MKFRNISRALLASAVSIGTVLGVSACGVGAVDFVYVTTAKTNPGEINVFKVDDQSGALVELPSSPYLSGGRNPVATFTSTDEKNLYVVNRDDNTLVQFAIGTDGKIYSQHTTNTPGGYPVAAAINQAGTFMFVVDTYAPGYSDTNPGTGALVVYPVDSTGALGTPVSNGSLQYWPLGTTPAAISVLPDSSAVYVANKADGTVSEFSVNTSTGALSVLDAGTLTAGVTPNAMALETTGRFLYITDFAQNQLIPYTVLSNGALRLFNTSTYKTGNQPSGITVDPRGLYIYVTNYSDGTVSAYTIDTTTGIPSGISDASANATRSGPKCVIVDPSLGRYVYTTNYLDNSVSAFQLNPNTGALVNVQNSPFVTETEPTCLSAITHGNHAVQYVQQ